MIGCTLRRAALTRRPAVVQCIKAQAKQLTRRRSLAGLTGAALLTLAAAVSLGEHLCAV